MSDAQSRFFGWNTNTDWTKCQSKDCIETIGVFSIDANAETNDFQNICNLSNMINSDRSSYDNGDTSYGTTIEFFNQMINIELERDEKWWSTQNNFHQLLTTEQEESIGDVTISYKKDYFKMEFDGHMYTGMNFELTSESEGVQPCTVFFGSDETFYLENLLTDDAEEVVTDDGRNVAIQKAYGAQSIFLAKTGPLDYKPFCDESLQFGAADPRSESEKKNDSGKTGSPYVLTDEIVEAEVEPEEVDVSTLNYLPPVIVIKRYTDISKILFVDTMIEEPVRLPDDTAYKARMQAEGFIVTYDFDTSAWPGGSDRSEEIREIVRSHGVVTSINLFRSTPNPLNFLLTLVGINTGKFYKSKIRTF